MSVAVTGKLVKFEDGRGKWLKNNNSKNQTRTQTNQPKKISKQATSSLSKTQLPPKMLHIILLKFKLRLKDSTPTLQKALL